MSELEKARAIPQDVKLAVTSWVDGHIVAEYGCPHGYVKPVDDPLPPIEGTLYTRWQCTESNSCFNGKNESVLWPVRKRPQQLVAEILGIDYRRWQEEREALMGNMLAESAEFK